MNVKIKKKLGSGVIGTVYLANVDGKDCIYKIEKVDTDGLACGTDSQYRRQIEFDNWAKTQKNLNVLSLLSYGVINSCKHTQDPIKTSDKKFAKFQADRNKLQDCCYLIYQPVLDGTLRDVRDKLTNSQYLDCIQQLISILNVMKKDGWEHRDLHDKNIMYSIQPNKKYKWYVVDYGLVRHSSFKISPEDKKQFEFVGDLNQLFWNVIVSNPLIPYLNGHPLHKIPPFKKFIDTIKKAPEWADIKTYVKISGTGKQKHMYNEVVAAHCLMRHPQLYLVALGLKEKDAVDLAKKNTHRFPELINFLITPYNVRRGNPIEKYHESCYGYHESCYMYHLFDDNYDAVLRKL